MVGSQAAPQAVKTCGTVWANLKGTLSSSSCTHEVIDSLQYDLFLHPLPSIQTGFFFLLPILCMFISVKGKF